MEVRSKTTPRDIAFGYETKNEGKCMKNKGEHECTCGFTDFQNWNPDLCE